MEEEIQLKIVGVVYNQTVVGTYGLVLGEVSGTRRFSVMIGEPEAQSIALKINNKKSARPLTHDLIHSILSIFSSKLRKVVIYNLVDEVFYSELHIQTPEKMRIVDARTSDAVALAVRSDAPIFIKSSILDMVGISINIEQEKRRFDEELEIDAETLTDADFDSFTKEELENLLAMAVKEEKYELAVKLRDAISRKSK